MWLRRPAVSLIASILVVAACAGGATPEDYFAALEDATNELDGRLDQVEARFNEGLLDIDFEAAGAEVDLVQLFRRSITSTAQSFATFLADMQAIDPPRGLEAPHQEAVRAGERVVAEFDADALEAISTLSDIDAYAGALSDSPAQSRFTESCRELQAIADSEGIAVDLGCS